MKNLEYSAGIERVYSVEFDPRTGIGSGTCVAVTKITDYKLWQLTFGDVTLLRWRGKKLSEYGYYMPAFKVNSHAFDVPVAAIYEEKLMPVLSVKILRTPTCYVDIDRTVA